MAGLPGIAFIAASDSGGNWGLINGARHDSITAQHNRGEYSYAKQDFDVLLSLRHPEDEISGPATALQAWKL
jgi:hypothetical protein